MAMNLIRNTRLVLVSAYPESHSSSSTRSMNTALKDILDNCKRDKGILDGGGSDNEARKHKEERMKEIWRVLCIHLGTLQRSLTGSGETRITNFTGRNKSSGVRR